MWSIFRKVSLMLALFMFTTLGAFADEAQQKAQETVGAPYEGELGLPAAASTIKVSVDKLNVVLQYGMIAITAFVFILLAIVIVRFRKSVHPVASRRTHNAPLEVLWTIIPVLILMALWWPSVKLTYYMDKAKNPEMTIKVVGHQWYWGYEYPDAGIDEYPSNMIPPAKIDKSRGQIRLLSVDQPLVIPVDTEIQYLITGSDVIHSWYIPSFGINKSAMPGRTNESWARALREGVFYGQCSKICGVNHGQMPIEIRVVSKEKFKEWAAMAKTDGVDKANKAVLGLQTASNDNVTATGTELASAAVKQ